MIDEITVQGGERMGTSQILVSSGLYVGQVWNSAVQKGALQALSRLSQIRRVDFAVEPRALRRVVVRIRVEEREPYGVVSLAGRGRFWVDREGYVLERVEGRPYLPVVTGVEVIPTPAGERIATEEMRHLVDEFFSLDGRTLSRFAELRFRQYYLELRAQQGWRALLPRGGLKSYLPRLDAVISSLGDSRWRTLDLRFAGEVIVIREP